MISLKTRPIYGQAFLTQISGNQNQPNVKVRHFLDVRTQIYRMAVALIRGAFSHSYNL